MPRKGTATVKKTSKYIFLDESDEDISPPGSGSDRDVVLSSSSRITAKVSSETFAEPNADAAAAREQLKLSTEDLEPVPGADQPRQDSVTKEQHAALANALFPNDSDPRTLKDTNTTTPSPAVSRPRQKDHLFAKHRPRVQDTDTPRSRVSIRDKAATNVSTAKPTKPLHLTSVGSSQQRPTLHSDSDCTLEDRDPDTMIQGGAFIAPNQQRNMRACMVCSIVRTQQQFMTQGCPNCEELLELAGNPEQINDCTSQVFEGLISVADTNRSWVARYQRLEGYVPGVYATQVEGILPEDVLVAVENAGVNYVPRDGSEQEMLGKD